tara:strand:+ start:506 stop:985 length:480 start_codon:yes stop_codon:yes gene_type:complete
MAYTLIAVQTSDNVGGARTDSNIYVKLYGNDGETTRLRLQDMAPDGNNALISVAENITAESGTIQFRIQSGVSLVLQQAFQSLLQDRTFTGYYVREAPTRPPTGVTFTNGVVEDGKWNGTVADPFATTRTQGEYDQMVALLRSRSIVSAPLGYTAAGVQ